MTITLHFYSFSFAALISSPNLIDVYFNAANVVDTLTIFYSVHPLPNLIFYESRSSITRQLRPRGISCE